MEKNHTIVKVSPLPEFRLAIQWSNGAAAELDLAPILRQKAYRALREAKLFSTVSIGDWGHSLNWPDDIELGADSLWRMTLTAQGRSDTVEFMDWRMRHGLSLTAAANALGISRRMVAYYASGEKEIPKTILLACKGWEATAA